MKNIYLLGECMVELKPGQPGIINQTFAGDVYNSAVYLKRSFPKLNPQLISAVGTDTLSEQMLSTFSDEGIGSNLVFRNEDKTVGLYLIETDSSGERSFVYWREQSAARQVMQHFNESQLDQFNDKDILFFSGISLAVIPQEDRDLLWQQVERIKERGVVIVFDPNYRPRMWSSPEQAKTQFDKAFSYSDIVLPGIEDFDSLYGLTDEDSVLTHLSQFDCSEIVIKNSDKYITSKANNLKQIHPIDPIDNVVDTTSAGDSFNGCYLGARLSGYTVSEAVKIASSAAGFVIQHPGAIAPKDQFTQFINTVI